MLKEFWRESSEQNVPRTDCSGRLRTTPDQMPPPAEAAGHTSQGPPKRGEKNFGGRVQNKMYPGQTATDPAPQPAEPSLRQSGPPNEVKRTLEGESRTNVPRTDGSGQTRTRPPQPLKPPMAPQNEEKRTLEGESRTNVPRTDGLQTDSGLGALCGLTLR